MRLHLRIIAMIATLLYVLILLLAAWWLLHNLLLAVVLGVAMSALVFAGWLIFAGSRRQAQGGWLLLGVGVLAVVAGFRWIADQPDVPRALPLLLLASVLYLVLVRFLRNKYWQQQRAENQPADGATRFSRPYLIVNPKSGDGRAIKANIPELAVTQNIEVLITKPADNVAELAERAVAAGADVLGVSGGDGSIGAVAKVALEHDLPIVVLPGGTRCHFARDLGLDPNRIADSLVGFSGVERRVDVGDINGRIFLNNASFGLYADIVDNPDYREHKVAVTRRVLQSVVDGSKPLYDLRFQHGSRNYHEAAQILLGVGSYNTVNLLELGHREQLDAGHLQITVLPAIHTNSMKLLLAPLKFRQSPELQGSEDFQQWETTRFRIRGPGKTLTVGVDGERETYQNPVVVRVRPQALRIYVPAEGVRNRPKNAFSLFMLKRLWTAGVRR